MPWEYWIENPIFSKQANVIASARTSSKGFTVTSDLMGITPTSSGAAMMYIFAGLHITLVMSCAFHIFCLVIVFRQATSFLCGSPHYCGARTISSHFCVRRIVSTDLEERYFARPSFLGIGLFLGRCSPDIAKCGQFYLPILPVFKTS